jgi:RNA polymerase sigma-70 factor (ECF subfamily)
VTLAEFEIAVSQFRDRVFGFALHYLGDRRDAEDVTQEVFIRLWDRANQVDEAHALPWLIRVTRNACVDAYRSRRTHRSLVVRDELRLQSAVAFTPTPEQATTDRLFADHLQDALSALQEPHRSIVILREIQGYNYREICDALDLPLTTVKVYLHRGRRLLRKKLSKLYDDETV